MGRTTSNTAIQYNLIVTATSKTNIGLVYQYSETPHQGLSEYLKFIAIEIEGVYFRP